ncbi:MAG: Do family serine endopeptidase [Alphaproteobacteria bacterium]|nr:Do family serine endopeptidase [Alphaproteobacteria bacterium]
MTAPPPAPPPSPPVELQVGGVPASSLPDVAERVVKSVVSVGIARHVRVRHGFGPGGDAVQEGLGSGVILSADGVILTNNHVVADADEVQVSLHDGRVVQAEVVGADPKTDVAVIRLKDPPADLVPIEVGDSDTLRLGEVVLAVGNPFGVGQTVTMGIVSALGRADLGIVDYEDFIQTDAAINPGNSGGALVDLHGRLVGINTAIYSRSGGSQGIGFAIPSARARQIADDILSDGKVDRGFLGVSIQDVDAKLADAMSVPPGGVLVTDVAPGTPAESAGVRPGDLVLEMNGKRVDDVARFRYAVAASGPDAPFTLTVLRDGQRQTLSGALADASANETAPVGLAATGHAVLEPLTDDLRQSQGLPGRVQGLYVRDAGDGVLAEAGVHAGDVILDANRVPVTSPQELGRWLTEAKGAQLLLRLYHQGDVRFVVVTP